jgi:hypothetical protein
MSYPWDDPRRDPRRAFMQNDQPSASASASGKAAPTQGSSRNPLDVLPGPGDQYRDPRHGSTAPWRHMGEWEGRREGWPCGWENTDKG